MQFPKPHHSPFYLEDWNYALTLNSIIAPFEGFEISCIRKCYGKWSICSYRANAPFSIIFQKYSKLHLNFSSILFKNSKENGPHSAVGNVSGYRCVSDCRSRGREFDPGTVPY